MSKPRRREHLFVRDVCTELNPGLKGVEEWKGLTFVHYQLGIRFCAHISYLILAKAQWSGGYHPHPHPPFMD